MKMLNKYVFTNKLILFLLLLSIFNGCKKENRWDCVKRTGTVIYEIRVLDYFDKIYLEDNVKVYLTQDSVQEVMVEAGENIVPLIITKVQDKILYISNNNRCNWARSYEKPIVVHLKMPIIKQITSDGTNDIIGLNTITTDTVRVRTKNSGNVELAINNMHVGAQMHGSGDVALKGYSNELICDIGGTAFLKCENLSTSYTWVHTFTTGLCYVRAADLLISEIDNVGDLYCYGNPLSVQNKQNGKGQLFLK
ncbi:MAG: DUF2807 domain-containing protein [Bacteroidia bacterium]